MINLILKKEIQQWLCDLIEKKNKQANKENNQGLPNVLLLINKKPIWQWHFVLIKLVRQEITLLICKVFHLYDGVEESFGRRIMRDLIIETFPVWMSFLLRCLLLRWILLGFNGFFYFRRFTLHHSIVDVHLHLL